MRGLALGVTLTAALGMHLAHGALNNARAQWPDDEDLLYLPAASHLRVMSVGYKDALADLIWTRAVVFAGSSMGKENYNWVRDYLRVINDLVPTFRWPYAWGGVVVVYSGETITREMVDTSIGIYREGVERFPEDHEMLFALGMILARDVSAAAGYSEQEVADAKRESSELVRRAAAFGAPPLVRQLAATLVSNGEADELSIQFLETQLLSADDEDYRRLLESKLEAIVGARRHDELVERRSR